MRYPVPGLPGVEVGVHHHRWCAWRNGRPVPQDLARPARYIDEHGNRVRRSINRLVLDAGAVEIAGHVIDLEWFPAYRLDWSARAGDWRVRSYAVASPHPVGSFLACFPHEYDGRPCSSLRNSVTRLTHARQLGWIACLAWHGRPPAVGCNACHRDGNPSRNGPDNLYWGTVAENAWDRQAQGRTRGITPGGGRWRAQREAERAERHAREATMTDDELIWGER